jgi:DNA-directed RNA polymerase subunit RPC12/RpoP
MIEHDINFVCPTCQHTRLVEVREQVEMRRVVERILVATDGRKYNPLTGSVSISSGKVVGYECEACGNRLESVSQTFRRRKSFVKSASNLFHWLMRNGMIGECNGS